MFAIYDWPGNIRELENMIKRVVILQDEQLVVREIQSNMQRAAAQPAMVAAAPAVAMAAAGALAGAGGSVVPIGISPFPAPVAPDTDEAADEGEPEPEGGGSLAQVAKAASMKAERAAIEHDAATGALEPPQGGADSRRQLQDAAEQDQGVRHQPSLSLSRSSSRRRSELGRIRCCFLP